MDWTQTELARRAGVSQPTISEYENDAVTEHRAHILMKIAAALGTTPEYLLTGKTPKKLSDAPSDMRELMHVAENMTKDELSVLLATARAILLTSKK